jgi:peptidoglycan/LPS O-acetylase OafA/YrhL
MVGMTNSLLEKKHRTADVSTSALTHPKYRPDIDGLRAVAVLLVMAYHTFPGTVKGGFTGVDVFFVISGFLISSIILENVERGSFSFLEFYVRRIRRIFPALIAVLAAVVAFGWFALLADEYKQVGEHVAGGAGFVANFVLWQESGYFETGADAKPLLHLWSLGVEEQFYIVWPLLLWGAHRLRLGWAAAIGLIGIASFAWNAYQADSDPIGTFYSPQTRFWELLVGAWLAYLALDKRNAVVRAVERLGPGLPTRVRVGEVARRELQGALGALLVALSPLVISRDLHFPGWWALLPTVGAALVIAAGPNAWINRRVLAHPAMVWVGLISYPLYLWHWPMLSLAPALSYTPFAEGRLTVEELRIAAVLLSIPLAWLTYKVVETPLRFGGGRRIKAAALVGAMVVVGGAGYSVFAKEGVAARNPEINHFFAYFENSKPRYQYLEKLGIIERYRTDCNFYDVAKDRNFQPTQVPLPALAPACTTKAKADDKAVFIWGDSHASQLNYGLEQTLPPGWEILIVATSACPANVDAPADHKEAICDKTNSLAMKTITEVKPEVVIVAQQREHSAERMKYISDRLASLGVKKTVFTGPVPQWEASLPTIIAKRLQFYRAEDIPQRSRLSLRLDVAKANDELARQVAAQKLVYVDLFGVFCNAEGCLTRLGPRLDADSVTWDYGHLTPLASIYLARNRLAGVVFGEDWKQ